MLKFSKRNSEHDDLYGRVPVPKQRNSTFAVDDDDSHLDSDDSIGT